MDNSQFYTALLARDRKFDGRFFVGVTSTGIYCRPVCRVKTPKSENCRFFGSAAAAEQAGFRPCLRCRPELAPGLSPMDAGSRYVQVATTLIGRGYLSEAGCEGLAQRLGITDRHLRRLFAEAFGVSPVEYAQSQRLLLAKRLLMDTDLPMTDVAFAAGFGSVRRFNELFVERYRLNPGDIRKKREIAPVMEADHVVFKLAYRPPYDWTWMLQFWADRAIAGVERVADDGYCRSLSLQHQGRTLTGWYHLTPVAEEPAVQVKVAVSLLPVLTTVLQLIRRQFDLDASPDEISTGLGALAEDYPGSRLPGTVSGFEVAVRTIFEQVISTQAARRLLGDLAMRYGEPVVTPFTDVSRQFPTAETLASLPVETLAALKITRQKAAAVIALARKVVEGHLELDHVVDVVAMTRQLEEIDGIGPWSSNYIAMRAWAWPDAYLPDDYVIKKLFPAYTTRTREAMSSRWRPWRSYAVFLLWRHWMDKRPLPDDNLMQKEDA